MRNRFLTGLAVVVVLLAGVAAYVGWQVDARRARVWDVPATPLAADAGLPGDVHLVARGAHLAQTRGCMDCHTADLGGQAFIDDPMMGHIVAGNLTGGRGGVLARYDDARLARAIRHGVRDDGRSLLVMPAIDYFPLGDADVAALIAYLRQLPAVDREFGQSHLGPLSSALLVFGGAPWISAERVDHAALRMVVPEATVSAGYGRYVAATCLSCHGTNFAGGIVNGPPGTPASANLTSAGELRGWSEAQFLALMREGRTPAGRQLAPDVMPWPAFAKMSDTELRALWAYLQTVPAVAKAG
ncbi:MAG: cytochrome c4 [Solimonas sp.]